MFAGIALVVRIVLFEFFIDNFYSKRARVTNDHSTAKAIFVNEYNYSTSGNSGKPSAVMSVDSVL